MMNNMVLHTHAQQVADFALKAAGLPITFLPIARVVRRPAKIVLDIGLGNVPR